MAKHKPRSNAANIAGEAVEESLAACMRSIGWLFRRQVKLGRNIYADYANPDDRRPYVMRVDFVIDNLQDYPRGLILEVKWQSSKGSVDEKFPYLVDNLRTCSLPSIVVAAGGGVRSGAIGYMRAHCDGQHLIAVYNMDGFYQWAFRCQTVIESDHAEICNRPINA